MKRTVFSSIICGAVFAVFVGGGLGLSVNSAEAQTISNAGIYTPGGGVSDAAASSGVITPPVGYNGASAGGTVVGGQAYVPASAVSREAAEEAAFEEAMRAFMPMSPEQILEMRTRLDTIQNAGSRPVREQTAVSGSVDISLDPGNEPEIIRLGPDMVSALNFIDSSGEPWPVAAVVVGNPDSFSVNAPIEGGNLVTITPLSPHARGNMSISLVELPTPIVVRLESSFDAVDFRKDMRILQRGPNALPDISYLGGGLTAGDDSFASFLDGVPPEGADTVTVTGGSARAWLYNGMLYMRTTMTLLSPAWETSAMGAAGMRVYRLPETPVVLVSDNGRLLSLTLE